MKRFKLNEAIASYDSFLKLNETEVSSDSSTQTSQTYSTVAEPVVNSEYVSKLSAEIDDIINGLKDLSVHLEPVEESKDNEKLYENSLIDTFFAGDPLFPLLAGGIGAILGILGLSIKAVKDSKRNAKLGVGVEKDYDTLKELKLEEVRAEGAIEKVKAELGGYKADTNQPDDEDRMATNDADPRQKAVANKLKTALATLQKKKDDAGAEADKQQAFLDEKYGENNLNGFFAGKVRRIIALKKDEIRSAVASLRLQMLKGVMSPEEEKRQKDIIADANGKMKQTLADAQKETQENQEKVDANAEKIAGALQEKIDELTQAKDSQEGADALKTEMKIIGLKMQKAKVEKDNEKVDLFKGKLAEIRKKIKDTESGENTGSEKEPEGEEKPDNTEKIAAIDKEIETLTSSKEGKEGSEANDIEKQILGKKIAKAKLQDDQEEVTKLTKELDDMRKAEVTDQEPEAEKNSKDDKLQRIDDLIKKEEEKIAKNPNVEKSKAKIKELEDAIDSIQKKDKKEKGDQDKIDMIKTGIEAEKKKMEKEASSDNLKKLKDLKDKISAKESWQLEGTELGRIFEMEIKKFEAMYALNEGLLSVKDRFSQLL